MELSQKLKKLRKEQGLTQLDLSESLFVSRQAISGWEAGTSRPSTENLQFLSKLYNVPMEYLLDDSKDIPQGRFGIIDNEKSVQKRRQGIICPAFFLITVCPFALCVNR